MMSYIKNIEDLLAEPFCSVIFAENSTMAAEIFQEFAAQHPEYISGPGKQFGETTGVFRSRNTQRFYNLIHSTEKIQKVRKKYNSGLTVDHAIRRQISRMKLKLVDVEHRTIAELSPLERLRVSMLCDVLNGKTKFIISDGSDASRESCFIISQYMKNYEDYDSGETISYQLVWVTDSTPGEMLDLMGEEEWQSDHYRFYIMQDGCAVVLDKESQMGNCPVIHETVKAVPEKPAAKTQTEEELEREEKAFDEAFSKLIDQEKIFRGLDEFLGKNR